MFDHQVIYGAFLGNPVANFNGKWTSLSVMDWEEYRDHRLIDERLVTLPGKSPGLAELLTKSEGKYRMHG